MANIKRTGRPKKKNTSAPVVYGESKLMVNPTRRGRGVISKMLTTKIPSRIPSNFLIKYNVCFPYTFRNFLREKIRKTRKKRVVQKIFPMRILPDKSELFKNQTHQVVLWKQFLHAEFVEQFWRLALSFQLEQ